MRGLEDIIKVFEDINKIIIETSPENGFREEDIPAHPLDTKNLKFIERYGPPIRCVGNRHVVDWGAHEKDKRFNMIMNFYDRPIFIPLDYSSSSFVLHGDIYHDLATPEFARLRHVKQLGTVELNIVMTGLGQTRLEHSYLVAALADSILTHKGFDQKTINLGIAAGMYHDIATPPYSEQGKLADKEALSEEKNAGKVIRNSERMQMALKRYGIHDKDVVACIKGEYPLVGRLINSEGIDLDKIAYLSKDIGSLINLDIYFRYCGEDKTGERWFNEFMDFKERLIKMLRLDLEIFDIYKEISFVGDEPVFVNPKNAHNFLFLRAMMFQNVYFNKFNRSKEAFLERELKGLWGKGALNLDNMASMNDLQFSEYIKRHMDEELFDIFFYRITRPIFVEKEAHYGKTKAEVEKGLAERGVNLKEVIVKEWKAFNPATSVKILHKGEAVPFEELMPKRADEIKNIAKKTEYTGVYEKAEHS